MSGLVQRLIALEENVRYREAPPPGEPPFAYRPGKIPVLLSAPHACRHKRGEAHKAEENFTAAYALLLAERTGAHALYAHRQSEVDPNSDRGIPYKMTLANVVSDAGIRLVLDLHGAAFGRDFGIALGTMGGVSCPLYRPGILAALVAEGFHPGATGLARLDVDHAFKASGTAVRQTITRFVWRHLGVEAAQFELHERLRVVARRSDASQPAASPPDLEGLVRALRALEAIIRHV